jgi:hypothetical protein
VFRAPNGSLTQTPVTLNVPLSGLRVEVKPFMTTACRPCWTSSPTAFP